MAKGTKAPRDERPGATETQIEGPPADPSVGVGPVGAELDVPPDLRALVEEQREEIDRVRSDLEEVRGEIAQLRELTGVRLSALAGSINRTLERMSAAGSDASAAPARPSVLLRVRTRDGRKRHVTAAGAFGRDWTAVHTDALSESQIETMRHDPVLEIEVDEG